MKAWRKLLENWRAGAASAALSVVLGLCFLVFGVGESLTNLSYDIPFAFRPRVVPNEVTIVYMDEESHQRLDQQPRWDLWDRRLHARLIDRLREYGAKAVVFDVWFEKTNIAAADRALIEAVKRHGKVAVASVAGVFTLNRQPMGLELVPPFPELREAVAGWGMVQVGDGEKFFRDHYSGELNVPSLNWKVAQLTMEKPPSLEQARWMNYYGAPGSIPSESYYSVISNTAPLAALSNKVVYVGALFSVGFSGGKGSDDFKTPYTRWELDHRKSPGVEINATAYLNLLRGDWLNRLSPITEACVIFFIGGVAGWALAAMRPLWAAAVGLSVIGVIAILGCAVLWRMRLWFPWMIVDVVQIPCAVICSALFYTTRLNQEKRLLEQRLATPVIWGTEHASASAETSQNPTVNTSDVVQEMLRLRGELARGYSSGQAKVDGREVAPPIVHDHQMLQCIGKGAYGQVWLARTVMGSYRAVKIVRKENFPDGRPYEREFEGIRHFEPISRNHPGVVHILHAGRDDVLGYFYYSMELADDFEKGQQIDPSTYRAKNLAKVIAKQGPTPLAECLRLAKSLTAALKYLHEQGLIHRDIKPSNIIFVRDEPKIADIGLVTDIGEIKSFVGTQGYVPREGPGTPLADIYSLGKVLYELITGFECARFPELPTIFAEPDQYKEVARFNDIVLKACQADCEKRYQSAEAMYEDIVELQEGKKVDA